MAYFMNPGPYPDAMFTIPCDHAGAQFAGDASTISKVTEEGSSQTAQNSLGMNLNTLRDIWAYIPPHSVPASPTPNAMSVAYDSEDSDADSWTTVLSPWGVETAISTFGGETQSQRRSGTHRPSPATRSTSIPPVHRPKTTDSGRVKSLLRASGLSVRTQGLESYYPFSRIFRPGGNVGSILDSRPDMSY